MAIYIGGSIEVLNYNCKTKVITDNLPITIFKAYGNELLDPYALNWQQINQQEYDKIKNKEINLLNYICNIKDNYAQLLIKIDLFPYCHDLGLSNSDLKRKLNDVIINIEDKYKCRKYYYKNKSWNFYNKELINDKNIICDDNKVYILLRGYHKCDSVIPSNICLRYFDIKFKFTRKADIVQRFDKKMNNKWMIMFNYYPNYDSYKSLSAINSILSIEEEGILNLYYNNEDNSIILTYSGNKKICKIQLNQFYKLQRIGICIKMIDSKLYMYVNDINNEFKESNMYVYNNGLRDIKFKFFIGTNISGNEYSYGFYDNFQIKNGIIHNEKDIKDLLKKGNDLVIYQDKTVYNTWYNLKTKHITWNIANKNKIIWNNLKEYNFVLYNRSDFDE